MIIQIGTEVDESRILWKHNEKDEWQRADIDELIDAYESIVRCKDCRHQEHCHETVAHTKRHDDSINCWTETIEWCSRGERKQP